MKKLLAIGLLCFIIGCSESPVDNDGRYLAEKSGNLSSVRLYKGSVDIDFRYIMIDGHEYVLMTAVYMGGLTHSPKCPCLKNKVEIVLPLNDAVTNEMTQVVPL